MSTNHNLSKFLLSVFRLAIFIVFPYALSAQGTDTLSLQQCIALAVKNNQSLQNKRLDELIEQARIDETKADLYPQAKIKGSYQYYLDVPTSLVPASAFGGPPGEYTFTQFQVDQNITTSFDVSWQVYNPAILAALKISKLSKTMSSVATKDKLEAIIYDVSATYLNVQINELQASLTRANITNLKKNLELTTQLYNQDLALRSDLDNLQVSIVNLETVLNNQLNGISQLNYLLKVYIGLPIDFALKVEKYRPENDSSPTLTSLDTSIYQKRSAYLSLQQAGDLLHLDRESIRAGFRPSVNLIGSFGYSGLNPKLQAFTAYNNRWYPTNLIQLNLEIPVFDGFKKRNQLLKNQLESQQNLNSLTALANTLKMEQVNAQNDFKRYLQDLEYQRKNLELANKLYTQKLLEYQNSMASLNDMIAVENTLKSAQTNYLNVLIKLKLAELDLKKANGQLINNNQ